MKALALDTAALVGETVLRVQDLGIDLLPTTSSVSARNLLRGCSFELRSGERLTLVGESGAGKSLLAQAIMGTLSQAMRATGRVQLVGRDTDGHRHLTRPLWGKQVVMLPQEPWSALNPVMRLRTQVAEAGRYAGGCSWPEAFERADRHLAALGLAHAGRLWLHQVSGGMAQRVGIACASQSDARVLIADEPTKGLDAGACEQVAHLLASAQKQGQALLTITHDLELAARLGGQIAVMRQGTIVEAGEAATVLQAPQHSYTRELVAAQPRHWPHMVSPGRPSQNAQGPVVLAKDIKVRFGAHEVLQGVDLDMGPGESVAVVGPSGCGKTTLGNALVGIAPVHSGSVSRLPGAAGWRFQKLYQDPVASFPAQQTLRRGLNDLLNLHRLHPAPGALAGALEPYRQFAGQASQPSVWRGTPADVHLAGHVAGAGVSVC